MSDELTISGGGSHAVASDALFRAAQALEEVSDEARWVANALVSIDGRLGAGLLRRGDAPVSAFDAERHLDYAVAALGAAQARATVIVAALRISAEGYGRAEQATERVMQALAARVGYGMGLLLPLFAAVMLPALPLAVLGFVIVSLAAPGGVGAGPDALREFLKDNNRLLTNPVTVALIRAGVMGIDDAIGGALRVPAELVRALGDEGAGLFGLDTSAAFAAVIGSRVGLLQESAVATRASGQRDVAAAPRGLAERIDRMPERTRSAAGGATGAHILIERYRQPGQPDRFEVYISGTADFSPISGTEAFDLTSDVHGVAGLPAGSLRAVQQAMADAGVTGSTPVQFNGYSQGGLIAVQLAASGEYDTRGVFTAGAPTAHVELPAHIPVVELEHTDDLVPALGGTRVDNHAVLVEREAFAGRSTPPDTAVPAHDRGEYRRTAYLADRAGSEQLTTAIGAINGFAAGATQATSRAYVARRVP